MGFKKKSAVQPLATVVGECALTSCRVERDIVRGQHVSPTPIGAPMHKRLHPLLPSSSGSRNIGIPALFHGFERDGLDHRLQAFMRNVDLKKIGDPLNASCKISLHVGVVHDMNIFEVPVVPPGLRDG